MFFRMTGTYRKVRSIHQSASEILNRGTGSFFLKQNSYMPTKVHFVCNQPSNPYQKIAQMNILCNQGVLSSLTFRIECNENGFRALKKLGFRLRTTEQKEWVLEHFDYDVTANIVFDDGLFAIFKMSSKSNKPIPASVINLVQQFISDVQLDQQVAI